MFGSTTGELEKIFCTIFFLKLFHISFPVFSLETRRNIVMRWVKAFFDDTYSELSKYLPVRSQQ